jgi:hypothetical protein
MYVRTYVRTYLFMYARMYVSLCYVCIVYICMHAYIMYPFTVLPILSLQLHAGFFYPSSLPLHWLLLLGGIVQTVPRTAVIL